MQNHFITLYKYDFRELFTNYRALKVYGPKYESTEVITKIFH